MSVFFRGVYSSLLASAIMLGSLALATQAQAEESTPIPARDLGSIAAPSAQAVDTPVTPAADLGTINVTDSNITPSALFATAPGDSFTITNSARCDVRIAELTIDLVGSAGNLIFDTDPGGLGLSVYQPFELVAGG